MPISTTTTTTTTTTSHHESREKSFAETLDLQIRHEEEQILKLRELISQNQSEKSLIEGNLLTLTQEIEFLRGKLEKIDEINLKVRLQKVADRKQMVFRKRERVKELRRSLVKFDDFEPTTTNESLKRQIDELKKSRLSLEMSFVEL